MQLNAVVRDFGSGNQSWLGSKHATDAAQTVTLDGSAFAKFADDEVIPSGIAIVKKGEKFVPATDKFDGFVFTDQAFDGKGDVIAPMVDHGRVLVDKLPEQATKFTADSNPHFVLVGAKAAPSAPKSKES